MFLYKNGYTDVRLMLVDICKGMVAGGFVIESIDGDVNSKILPPSFPVGTPDVPVEFTEFKVCLSASVACDPLAVEQPWRIVFTVREDSTASMVGAAIPQYLDVNIATDIQIAKDGNVAFFSGVEKTQYQVGALVREGWTSIIDDKDTMHRNTFFSYPGMLGQWKSDSVLGKVDPRTMPLSFHLTCAKHGFSLFVMVEGYDHSGRAYSMCTVQRMINSTDGSVIVGGKSPLFCLYSISASIEEDVHSVDQTGDAQILVIRESDVNSPAMYRIASRDTPDGHRMINPLQQISLTEDEKYVIHLPRNLNSTRFYYAHELDLIEYTAAELTSQYQESPVRLYGEDTDRSYKAMRANGKNNTGMRWAILSKSDKLIDISGAVV